MSTNRNSEQWQMVGGFPGYAVSNRGRVLSLPRYIEQSGLHGGTPCNKGPKLLRPRIAGAGYLQVVLYCEGKRFAKYVHVLVAAAFCPLNGTRQEVNHIDGNKGNNRADNLEWASRIENMRHAVKTGAFDGLREAMRGNRHALGQSIGVVSTPRKTRRNQVRAYLESIK
jgi:hypothetical protein